MSLKEYDEGIRDKLVAVFPNVISASPDVAFKESSVDGKVKLPLISVYRVGMEFNWGYYNSAQTFIGEKVVYQTADKTLVLGKSLPLLLRYQVDIWAQKREFADGILRELLFFFVEEPYITIEATKQESPQFTLNIESLEDNTDITSYPDLGKIYRYTLTYNVPSGKIFLYKDTKYVETIPIEFFALGLNE